MSICRSLKTGFTLIELAVVLFILGLVAHMAVREASKLKESKLRLAANRQLAEIARAVYDDGLDGPSGFLADMGRLPRVAYAAGDADSGPLTLRELYERPEGVRDYAARYATAANLAPGAPGEIADASLCVPCGWGGPYLRLPVGRQRLTDPWGNYIESPDEAGLARLLDANSNAVATAGQTVALLRHYGSDGMADATKSPATEEQRDATFPLPASASSCGVLLTFPSGSVTNVFWYSPSGSAITGGVRRVSSGECQVLVDGLSPGVRYLKVFRSDALPRVLQVMLKPGRTAQVSLE